VLEALPLAALTNGLRVALEQGTLPLAELVILATWAALLGAITSRTFRFS
jgi:hypothetical protein